LVLVLSQVPGIAKASTPFRWDQFKGVTLKVLLHQNHWQGCLAEAFPAFEKLTGIRLQVEVYGQAQLWDVLERALPEPGRVDVFATVPALDGLRYHRLGWLRPINDYLASARLTAPDYAWDELLPGFRAGVRVPGGALLGTPVMGEFLALLYRKDLFQRARLKAPSTLAEFQAAAATLHGQPMTAKGGRGVGLVARGQGALATALYASLLHALGGTWLDAAGQPTLDRPESLAALELLRTLFTRYGPPGIATFDLQEATAFFTSGQAAMYLGGASVYPLFERAGSSQVRGQVGYAPFPGGPGGSGTTIATWGLAIAKGSAHPDAAWLFSQWASASAQAQIAFAKGVLVPRASAWRMEKSSGIPPDLAAAFLDAGNRGNPAFVPPLVAVTAAREAVGAAITAALTGGDLRRAATEAAARLREIIRQTEH
jgi:multiple sugar transport system substrate-binding protein